MVKQRTQPSQANAGAQPPGRGPGQAVAAADSPLAAGCTAPEPMATEGDASLPAACTEAAATGDHAPDMAEPASQTPPPLVYTRAGATPEPGGLDETPVVQPSLDMVACTLVSPTQPLQPGAPQPSAAGCLGPGMTLPPARRAMQSGPSGPGLAAGPATACGLRPGFESRVTAPGPFGDLAPLGGPEPAPIVLRPPAGSSSASAKGLTAMSLADDDEDDIDLEALELIDQMHGIQAGSSGNSSGGAGKFSGAQAATTVGTKAADCCIQAGSMQATAPGSTSGTADALPMTQALPPAAVVVGPAARFPRPPLAPGSLSAVSNRYEPPWQAPQSVQPLLQPQQMHQPQALRSQAAKPVQASVPAELLHQQPPQLPQPAAMCNQPQQPTPAQQLVVQPQPAPPALMLAPRASTTSGGGDGWDDDDDGVDFDIDAVVAKAVSNSRPASPSGPSSAAALPAAAQMPTSAGPLDSAHDALDPAHLLGGRPPPASTLVASAHQPHPLPVQHQQQAPALCGASAAGVASAAGTQEAGVGVQGGSGGREDYHYVVMEVQACGSGQQHLLRLRCLNQHKVRRRRILLATCRHGAAVEKGRLPVQLVTRAAWHAACRCLYHDLTSGHPHTSHVALPGTAGHGAAGAPVRHVGASGGAAGRQRQCAGRQAGGRGRGLRRVGDQRPAGPVRAAPRRAAVG